MKNWLTACLLFAWTLLHSQQRIDSLPASREFPSLKARPWIIGSLTVAGYAGSFVFLNAAWYKGYPRSVFHTFNDAGEWLQMDKLGHTWTAYTTSRLTTAVWQWAGSSKNQSV